MGSSPIFHFYEMIIAQMDRALKFLFSFVPCVYKSDYGVEYRYFDRLNIYNH